MSKIPRRMHPGLPIGSESRDPAEIELKRHRAQAVAAAGVTGAGLLAHSAYKSYEASSDEAKALGKTLAQAKYDSPLDKLQGIAEIAADKIRGSGLSREEYGGKMRNIWSDYNTLLRDGKRYMAEKTHAMQASQAMEEARRRAPQAIGAALLAGGLYYGGSRLMAKYPKEDQEKVAMIKGFYKSAVSGGPESAVPAMPAEMARGLLDALKQRDVTGQEGGATKMVQAVNTGEPVSQPVSEHRPSELVPATDDTAGTDRA